MTIDLSPAASEFLLAFADDEHMIGSRHAAWIGLGPFLEEDLAFCSIAQDELGHAIALYELLTDEVDHFALLRPAADYRSAWLSEWPCQQWHESLVRHWLYDEAETLRWASFEDSSIEGLGMLAARAEREEAFHRDHAAMYMSRIADGDDQGRSMIDAALETMVPLGLGLWDPVAGEAAALAEGIMSTSSADLCSQWSRIIGAKLEQWGFTSPLAPNAASIVPPAQANRTVRSPHFAELHQSLQEVIVLDPQATW